MINIGLVSHSSALCGAERMLFNLAIILKQSTVYNPVVYIPNGPSKDLEVLCKENGIRTVNLLDYVQYIYTTQQTYMDDSKKTLELYKELARIFINDNISLVINNTATSVLPTLAGVELQIPVISWIHGILDSYMLTPEYNPERRLFFDRMYIALSDIVLCCSEWTTVHYNQYNISPVITLHNWTVEPKYTKEVDLENKTFVCLNTFDKYKGIFTLLEAVTVLRNKHDNFRVLLYGDGSPAVKIKIDDFISVNNLENNVKIMRRTNDISSVYNDCLCLVQPSFIESFGMTIIEAMAHSRPTIAARSGGPEEIILDNETGLLIQRDDAEDLANKMAYILEHPDKVRELGMFGYQVYKEKFSISRAAREFYDILDGVLKNYRGISKEKQLYFDSLIRILNAETSNTNIQSKNINLITTDRVAKLIEPEKICYSGQIRRIRKYEVVCDTNQLSALGIIFASDFYGCIGTVCMYLKANGRILRESSTSLDKVKYHQWTVFNFPTVYHCGGKNLIVELIFDYSSNSPQMGVIENRRNRTFIYRLFNKIGIPHKGSDTLFVDQIE